ncbi:MAG TPA: glycosyl transferase family 90 [Candidatus Dormibacteraeota bacterium]
MTVRVGGAGLRSELLGAARPQLPPSLIVLCRVPTGSGLGWLCDREPAGREQLRLAALLGHLERLQRKAGDESTWWTLVSLADAWREHDPPGPAGADVPWDAPASVLCFGSRSDDASAMLVAEPHYFMYDRYRRLRAKTLLLGLPWAWRRRSAIFAGGDHGRQVGLPDGSSTTPRRLLATVVADRRLPVRVALHGGTSVAEQLRYRVILDVDGHARTWEAWAWKLMSGSVVVSQTSDWQTRFTAEFEPRVHYLPVGEDFVDLADVLEWCQGHWPEARSIARRARRRARSVYSRDRVESSSEWRRISPALRPLAKLPADMPPA